MGQHKTLWEVVAGNVARLRKAHDWNQDELARRAREAGLEWTRSAVTWVESGSRELDVGELLLLAVALDVSPSELLETRTARVRIGEAEIPGRALLELLAGRGASFVDTAAARRRRDFWLKLEPELRRLLREVGVRATRRNLERLPLDWEHAAEQKTADRLGLTPPQVSAIALALWGRSLTEERDARAAGKEGHMYRAHATRRLTKEIEGKAHELGWTTRKEI